MTTRDPKVLLADALIAIADVQENVRGYDEAVFIADRMVEHAVERQLITLGEACSALRKIDPAMAGGIDELGQVIGTRHRLVHVYHAAAPSVVWNIVVSFLPPLRERVAALLAAAEGLPP